MKLVSSLEKPDSSLSSRTGRLANEIFTGDFVWDRKSRNVEAIKAVKRIDLIRFVNDVFRREHSVVQWIYGSKSSKEIQEAFIRFTRNRS